MRFPYFAARICFAAAAMTLLASAGAPPSNGTSNARVTVRIERSVALRAGEVRREKGRPASPPRERPCVEGDLPAGSQCRLLVTDIE